MSNSYYIKENDEYIRINESTALENVYVDSLVDYISRKNEK
jgi:hypothetical protein